jgi:hypothetical protein
MYPGLCPNRGRTGRWSAVGSGELGRDDVFDGSSTIVVSYCREYLLLEGVGGIPRPDEFRGLGDPLDEGVYCISRPPKES